MATDVILPALGMSQDTGKIVQWLKAEGEQVAKGEPLAEIETDKATVEIEAPAAGVLAHVAAAAGDDVPVGQVIAAILTPAEASEGKAARVDEQSSSGNGAAPPPRLEEARRPSITASPLASRIAAEHKLDLSVVKPTSRRISKADVLTYLQRQEGAASTTKPGRLLMASPKARRLAAEQGKDLAAIKGNGPEGAVLAADVLAALAPAGAAEVAVVAPAAEKPGIVSGTSTISNTWRIMAERTTQSWTSVPHFYLTREVNASRLITWRERVLKRSTEKVTYTDLLVKVVAAALRMHPRVNASWSEGKISLQQDVHVGLAVAVEEGLVVPVIHQADTLSLDELARRRMELVTKAQAGKLRPQDISGGTFTISNLGMYNVDAFNAIINQPQAAILAVGRIAERVVPVNSQPAVQPMMVLTLSCDHRVVDGARGAQFLATLAELIEEPLGLLA
ncbi:MAG: dihydrolipoamide acetyltransferase family protein [Ktedonobacteraceae bacterium]